MSGLSGGSSSNSRSSFESRDSVGQQTRALRESYIKAPNGDLIGNNYVVPKGDFGAFLGYDKPTMQEASGGKPLTGNRIIEIALQQEMKEIGMGATKNGNNYRNSGIAWGRYQNEPGREKDMLRDALDAMKQGQDKNTIEDKVGRMTAGSVTPYFEQLQKFQDGSRNDNIKYLEMQYKFQEISKQEGTISNLMKTRHDCVSRSIRGGQG